MGNQVTVIRITLAVRSCRLKLMTAMSCFLTVISHPSDVRKSSTLEMRPLCPTALLEPFFKFRASFPTTFWQQLLNSEFERRKVLEASFLMGTHHQSCSFMK